MEFILRQTKKATTSVFSILLRFWYISVILIAVAGYFIWQQQTAASIEELETHTVERVNLQDILSLSGEIDAEEKVDLHFQSVGRLSWVGVREGDYVDQFDGIASLDQRQLQKTLEKYLNTYSKERRDFEQTGDDNQSASIALSERLRDTAKRTLENAQFDLDNSVLDVELQTISKEYAFLYTPIEGIVTRVDAPSAGMNVALTDIYQIINPSSIYFAIAADQTDVVQLTEGMRGAVVLDSYPDEEVMGVVDSISFTPEAGETGTVYEVKLVLPENVAGTFYRLGMTGDVEFIIEELSDVVAVPFEYILEEEDGSYVNKKVGNNIEKIEVETGEEYGVMVEVVSGVSPGDVLVEITE